MKHIIYLLLFGCNQTPKNKALQEQEDIIFYILTDIYVSFNDTIPKPIRLTEDLLDEYSKSIYIDKKTCIDYAEDWNKTINEWNMFKQKDKTKSIQHRKAICFPISFDQYLQYNDKNSIRY